MAGKKQFSGFYSRVAEFRIQKLTYCTRTKRLRLTKKNQQRGESRMSPIQKWENIGHKLFREFIKNKCFSNYSASKLCGLQTHLLVNVAKIGFDFYNNSFQVILFSGQHFKYRVSAAFSSETFRQLSQKCIIRVQRWNWSQKFLRSKVQFFADFARNLNRKLKRRRIFGLKKYD